MFVKPNVLTIRTLATVETWEGRMNHIYQQEVSMAALRLRWRQSYKAGRTIAQPAATGSQLQAARRAVATPGPAAMEHVVTVAPAVAATAAPKEIMEAIRLLIASRGLTCG